MKNCEICCSSPRKLTRNCYSLEPCKFQHKTLPKTTEKKRAVPHFESQLALPRNTTNFALQTPEGTGDHNRKYSFLKELAISARESYTSVEFEALCSRTRTLPWGESDLEGHLLVFNSKVQRLFWAASAPPLTRREPLICKY